MTSTNTAIALTVVSSFAILTGIAGCMNQGTSTADSSVKTEGSSNPDQQATPEGDSMSDNQDYLKTDAEWKQLLTPMQYTVTRKHGTERAFTGEYWDNTRDGVYQCVCCGLPLFDSQTKYKSGTGWPSFWQPIGEQAVESRQDRTLFMVRTEVHCRRCKAHLGHVFDDGPEPTGLRYCINSASLNFSDRTADDAKGESESK